MTKLKLCSTLVILYSLSMLPPILIGLGHGEQDLFSSLLTFATAASIGTLGWWATRKGSHPLRTRDGFLIAVLFWLIFSSLSAMPFFLDQRLELGLVDAVFEGTPRITTTVASVFQDIDGLPKSILYYRAQLNFVGGPGIIVVAIAILPLLGVGGAKLYQSEMPGPLKEQRLTPRLLIAGTQALVSHSKVGVSVLTVYRNGRFGSLCIVSDYV